MRRGRLLALIVVVLLPACDWDFDLGDFSTPQSEFSQLLVWAECKRSFSCESKEWDPDAGRECSESDTLSPERYAIHRLLAAAEMGLVTYDDDAAFMCALSLSALCDDRIYSFETSPSCQAVFTGTVVEGEPCFIDEQCVSRRCVGATESSTACTVGTCGAPTATAQMGESCAELPCAATDGFDPRAFCSEAQVCEPARRAGESCRTTADCELALWCANDTCAPVTYPGDRCPCSSRWQRCDRETNKCVSAGRLGDPCDVSDCWAPLFCASSDLTCTERPGPGAACGYAKDGEFVCAGNAYCDTSALPATCVARRDNGTRCEMDDQCLSGHCDWSSCRCQDFESCFEHPPQADPRLCPSDEQAPGD